jgi:3-oxoacyl-[acyl-carrier-protein] synthase III
LHELLKQKRVRPGDKLVLGTAAAGFSMVSLAGVWEA